MNAGLTNDSADCGDDRDASSIDRRQRRIERILLISVLAVPLAILGIGFFQWFIENANFPSSTWLLYRILWPVETILLKCLFVWLAFRSPILGRKPIASVAVIALVIAYRILAIYWMNDAWNVAGASNDFAVYISVLQALLEFLSAMISFVFVRRVFSLVLTRTNEGRPTYRAISIGELMLWTFLIACYAGCRTGLVRAVESSGMDFISMSIWWEVSFLFRACFPAILILAIVLCWHLPKWKWLPLLTIVYAGLYTGYRVFEDGLLSTVVGPMPSFKFTWPHLRFVVSSIAIHVIVVWLLNRIGYRFHRIRRTKEDAQPAMH